ncbi:hypothetical protein Clacol_009208 [Clathrus columnatus]|uniref:Major facilitator superfamily (MFS) profile domain-containing protein n=1 Tax=Clathrus columnatus TaxID=1419009 RepID=A0AAV5AQH1_9AGAM|nr:hypothetical protein Clacol_009208 [Clathrus columnatus]
MGAGAAVASPGQAAYLHLRLVVLNAWICLLLITSYSNGYDGNGLLSLQNFENFFHHPQGGKLGLFNAIQNIGSLAGLPAAPYLTDWAGRRYAILFGAAIMCVGAAIQASSQDLAQFIIARFLMGFGLTFATNAAPCLVTELAYPTQRAQLTSCYNSLWYSGAIVAAWATFGTFYIKNTWSWRVPSLLQALPSVLQLCLLWWCPESPRWLISKGRYDEALNILAYYHANGNIDDPLVQFEFKEIKEAIELDREIALNVGYKSLFMTKGNRKRMRIFVAIAFFSQWSGNGLVSYYLNKVFDSIGITNTTIQLLINGILQIWNLAWALGSSFVCDRYGRRSMFITSCAGMLLFFTLQTICSARFAIAGTASAAHAVIAFIFLFYAAYDIAFTPLIVSYTVEILPYQIRAKGFNIFNFTISCAIIFNQYINPIALAHLQWKYYIFYDAWLAFELVYCYLFVIETKNRTLEETAMLFDGEENVDYLQNRVTKADSFSEKDEKAYHEEHV